MRNILILLLMAGLLSARAESTALISLSFSKANLEKVLKEIEKQSSYHFIYSKEAIDKAIPVTIEVKQQELVQVLKICFERQPLSYIIEETFIIIKTAVPTAIRQEANGDVRGKILSYENEPLGGLTITVKGTSKIVITDNEGSFLVQDVQPDATLLVTGAEIEPIEIKVNGQPYIMGRVKSKTNELDKVVMMAYGTTTKRTSTGNIGTVSADQIGSQPVTDPMATLEGRVPGLLVTQSNGVPGSAFKVQIRGQNSIGTSPGSLPLNNPLFIIDGVPYMPGANFLNQLPSAAGNAFTSGLSPFNIINPNDIESIEILKDADATAIYGSLAANGVVLITTKKGRSGKTKFNLEVNTSFGKITREMKFLNTRQYLDMRKEAYFNDRIIPTPLDAPDFLLWDTTRSVDWTKFLVGGTAHTYNVQTSFTGGTEKTQFLVGAGYHKETTVYPSDASDNKVTFHLNLNHNTKKMTLGITANYGYANNKLPLVDLSNYLYLPPNFPSLYDSLGNLKWSEKGVSFRSISSDLTNPLAYTLKKYNSNTDNLLTNITFKYQLGAGLNVRINAGYNLTNIDELSTDPLASKDPNRNRVASATYGTSKTRSWIIEPQIDYTITPKNLGQFNFLLGGTWQGADLNSTYLFGSGYPNDLFLNSISAASSVQSTNLLENYRYAAAFARISYNLNQTYLLNISGRRDGSSRFGPDKQFANFGAIGLGWVLSSYDFIKNKLPFVSFWKLRASYGTTGNDQIGNYQYLETWTNTSLPFNGSIGLYPLRLPNPDFSWEINKKFEANMDLGFMKNKLLIGVCYYRNRSGNQLVNYSLPIQTGFNSILENQPAVVQNEGWEITVNSQIINRKKIKWSSSFNVTIAKNKLVSFPGLNESPYAYNLTVGEPLSIIKGYRYAGVDLTSGLYQFYDADKDGSVSYPNDYFALGSLDPKYYGGWENNLQVGRMRFSFMFVFKKQIGPDYLGVAPYNVPGFIYNQSTEILNRWQKPGDVKPVQRFTQTYADAYASQSNLISSEHVFSDASYIRLKNIALSYDISNLISKKKGIDECTFFLRTQNLFTITRYTAGDPETRNPYTLPPLKVISVGIKISL